MDIELEDPAATARHITVTLSETREVLSESEDVIGRVDKIVAEIFQVLIETDGVDLQIRCRISSVLSQARKGKSRLAPKGTLSVIIYGPMDLFDAVGELFEKNGFFLQNPIGCDRIVEYRNPHRLSGDDLKPEMTRIEEPMAAVQIDCTSTPVDLLSGFETGDTLTETDDPLALRTPLCR